MWAIRVPELRDSTSEAVHEILEDVTEHLMDPICQAPMFRRAWGQCMWCCFVSEDDTSNCAYEM